jgi:type IV secretion system protein VirB6
MSLFCSSPDVGGGVAVGLSGFLDCQARALGENGFQALAGGPLGMSLLSGLLTIFVALIGYRLILGETPGIRDGVGWTVRLGFVLALVMSWPAFQTLVYRVAIDGPSEIAAILLPATGLPSDGVSARVQQAYDVIRRGGDGPLNQAQTALAVQGQNPAAATASPYRFQPPMPQTASLFVVSTTGFTGAFRIAVGFLLAVGPLALMALLFDATLGIFVGWIRAMAGMALASLAAVVVTSVDLVMVESELDYLRSMRLGGDPNNMDPQSLTTIVLVFALVTLVTAFAATRMTGAFKMVRTVARQPTLVDRATAVFERSFMPASRAAQELVAAAQASPAVQTRAAGVADALATTVRREQGQPYLVGAGASTGSARDGRTGLATRAEATALSAHGLGTRGRRGVVKRTRSATRRDKSR